MNESTVKNSSCLAITEKKPLKQGGCGGIIYQLFEWKKKLTKKKLFSKKLLPPARAKKFKGDEKMPNSKIHLIANENNGGFPSAKKGGNCGLDVVPKSEMRVPGLVARLMGLESIPAAKQDKYKKATHSDGCGDGEESEGSCDLDRQVTNLDIGVVRQDSRPQKLQETDVCERRAMTRFGTEALQIKNVLSRARKYSHIHHHHPKLASPLKTPRITSRKSASRSSRLIGAASRILEPGLQARRGAKGFLTHPASIYPKTGIVTDSEGSKSAVIQNQPDHDVCTAKPLMGHTSCKNCGNLLDVVDCTSNLGGQPAVSQPIVSDAITATSTLSAQNKERLSTPSHGQERDVVLLRSPERLVPLVTEKEGKNNAQQSCNEHSYKRMLVPHEVKATWNSPSQSFRTPEGDASFVLKHKAQTQERMLSGEKIPSRSSSSNMQTKRVSSSSITVNGTKDFVALNRSLSGQMRRSPTKVDCSKFDIEKKPSNRQNKSLSNARSLERKRRISNVAQVEGMDSVNSVGAKQRIHRSDVVGGKRRDLIASSFNSSNVKCKQSGKGKTVKVNDNKINEVVSFTFNSPLKKKIGEPDEKEETSSSNERRTCFQRPSPLIVNVLGAFLEQKLEELTSQEDELGMDAQSNKFATMILREMISLSSENMICHDGHKFNENVSVHYEAKQERLSGTSCNGNHLSPGSVLEASFSSSSLDESSGRGFHPNSMNCSYDKLNYDTEILDSATSFNKRRIVCEVLTDRVNQIPLALQNLYSFGASLTSSKLAHIKDVVLIAELVLGFDTDYTENEVPELLIYQFLLNELDTMASDTIWMDFYVDVGCLDSGHRKELKGFLFDCVIEYLERNCCQYFICRFKQWWTKLPQSLKAEMLAQEVKMEIKKWGSMAGMEPDEIIEWEMSHSLGKWIDFDIEAFEAGVDIGGDMFQILVDEIVEDLVGCKQG